MPHLWKSLPNHIVLNQHFLPIDLFRQWRRTLLSHYETTIQTTNANEDNANREQPFEFVFATRTSLSIHHRSLNLILKNNELIIYWAP